MLTRLCAEASWHVQALLGQGAMVVLDGQRVLPSRTQEQGFRFQYQDINPAIRQLLGG